MKPEPGDRVKVTTADEEIEGTLMPNEETDAVVIKLNSGYNVGIDSKKVKSIEVVEKLKEEKNTSKTELKKDSKKPTIAILHTGGTIASKVDYRTGGITPRFSPEEIVAMFPELKDIANITSELISNMFSEDMHIVHYKIMSEAIAKEAKKGVDGVILTHGTDTMGYSAAALAFALEGINIPVIIVGSQRSSDRGSSDAASNLLAAAHFITESDFVGVAICMHKTSDDGEAMILPACKTRKLHTSRRDAFQPVNDSALAFVDYKTGKITFQKEEYEKKSDKRKLNLKNKFEEKVAIVKAHPGMVPEQFKFYKDYKGLIIEGTGIGQAPVGNPNEHTKINLENLKAIESLVKGGCVVVMTSQCIFGRVHMHVYSAAIDLANVGVFGAEDMLSETAFIKLSWLLANHKKDEIKELMQTNLRGEINLRIMQDEFLE